MTHENYLLSTQPQYHSTVEVRRDLTKPSSPATSLKQSWLEKVAKDCPVGF